MTSSTARRNVAVIGAGQIGSRLAARLAADGHAVKWISRTRPTEVPAGVSFEALDVNNGERLATALGDAQAMIVAVNPSTYDAKVWAATLPPMHSGLIVAARQTGVRVVLLEGLYHYALDQGQIAPDTPHRPVTEKGRIRQTLVALWLASGTRPAILCASDFWGAGLRAALVTRAGVEGLQRGKAIVVVGNPDVPHAFTHVNDIVEGLVNLTLTDDVQGCTFHAPVTHMTQRELVALAAASVGAAAKTFKAPRWLLVVIGLVDKNIRGIVEMLPQWTRPYLVDDAAYRSRFGATATTRWAG